MMPLMLLPAAIALISLSQDPSFDPGPNPYLMRHPTVSADRIVFQFAGDLWWVPREGGAAARLTSAQGIESEPRFSPDGSKIAFTGQYDGNRDVYVMPAKGGVPKRLTAHPSADVVLGWSPDGKAVLFSSSMLSATDYPRMFTVPVGGGFPTALPFPAGVQACFSPDGNQIAYVPNPKWQEAWKRYRGGQATPIWIAQMSDSKWKPIPRKDWNDKSPMWVGDSIYYLSDPDGPVGLYRYDTDSGKTSAVIAGKGFDIKSATAGPGVIAYEKLGGIYLFDLQSKSSKRVPITIAGDFGEVRPQFKDLARNVSAIEISPTGQRLLVAARGIIFTVPAAKGDVRQIVESTGFHRRMPAWSPDGKTIAFITDQIGRQQMSLYDVETGRERLLELGDPPGYYAAPRWSPDSKWIAYRDNKLRLWVFDVSAGKNTIIDTGSYRGQAQPEPQWSSDSKWITWARDLPTHYQAIFVHSLASGKTTQITDGMAEASGPVFDRDGKHLYFIASTDIGQGIDFQDISSLNAPNATSSIYCVVLKKDGPNPLHPESDEEPIKEPAKEPAPKQDPPKKPEPPVTAIDLENIETRIIALPFPRQVYDSLEAGPAGTIFALSRPPKATAVDGSGPGTLHKFSFADRKVAPFAAGVTRFSICADGSKMALFTAAGPSIVPTAAPPQPGQGLVSLAGLKAKIAPVEEWKHMFEEVWRNQKMLFYAPNLHGIDADAMAARYRPFLANVRSRDDLNYLFTDMLGELCVGHMFIGGGDIPGAAPGVPGGLLGADYTFENGRYRLAKVYTGERWNPGLYGPLAQPGVQAKVGEYVLAIDGKDLTQATDIYEALENKAGKQVRVKLGPNHDGTGSREAIVVPVASEAALRERDWVETNRRIVFEKTNGRGAYVHVPDTGGGGWAAFQRYFYAQSGMDGLIVDDRFNGGGYINDFMVREMNKSLDFFSAPRYGMNWLIPPTGIYGPKVMLINEMAGSGGDIFPYLFRQQKTGTLVGKRTWGAMITNYGFNLADGGRISSPDDAMFNVKTGEWIIENYGTPPDIEVEMDPYLWRQGRDAQLEAAIAQLNRDLANFKPLRPKTPPYPDWSKVRKGGGQGPLP
jgi:tricorn protease